MAGLRQFVGRAPELGVVEAVCAGAAGSGRGGLVVVTGEAGIGKSRFCEEAADRAGEAGLRVVSARCWSDGGAPPLWPWHPVLAELCGDDAAGLLAADSDRDRFTRFAAVLDRLRSAGPACVVIDDAHAADTGTLVLVRFVARVLRSLPVVLVVSRRPGEPAAGCPGREVLDEIEQDATVMPLHRFDAAEAAVFLAEHGLGDLDDDLIEAVVRVTGGNPLFLRQIAALGPPEPGHALPGGVRVAIEQALVRLGPDDQQLLATAAVLGLTPSVAEAAAVAERNAVAVLEAVTGASRAGLVTTQGADRFAFTHELVRLALEESLAAEERLAAHARAARLVASDDCAARRAHHALLAAARSPGDARVAVEACRAAAEDVAGRFGYEQADTFLSAAVELHERSVLGPPPGELVVEWAQAALRCGRMSEARRRFDQAAIEADPVLMAEVALGLGGHWVNEHRTPVERARVLGLQRTALAALPLQETALRCRLTGRLAAEDVFDGGPVAPVLAAIDAARDEGDLGALAEVLSLCHHALFTPGHTRSRLALAEELVAVASEAGEGVLALMGLCWRAVDLFHLGDPAAARALEDLRERAAALACQNIVYIVGVMDVMLLVRAGRLDEAEDRASRCYELGEAVGEVDTLGYLSTQLLGIRWLQGREVELLEAAHEVAVSPTLIKAEFALQASAAAIAARAGEGEQARAALDRLTADGLASLPQSSTWGAGMAAIVEAAALLEDEKLAREVYDLLSPWADLPVIASVGVLCLGSAERLLGVAAATFGENDRAAWHLERALAANRRLGNRPLAALTRAELAGALARRGRPQDRPHIVELLEEAVAEATEMGMTARAEAWRAELAAWRPNQPVRRGTIRRDGTRWVVAVDDRRVRVGDLLGMAYLADLLTQPGTPIPALTLTGAPVERTHQAVIDEDARAAYAARARELSDELAAAETRGDAAGAARAREEVDALLDELEGTAGLHRRPRTFTDNAERARTAVRKAIKRAIDALDDADPAIADTLRTTVTTGVECVYIPDPRQPVAWSR